MSEHHSSLLTWRFIVEVDEDYIDAVTSILDGLGAAGVIKRCALRAVPQTLGDDSTPQA